MSNVVNINQPKYPLMPDRIRGAIDRYVEHGLMPGSFTQAVLENRLMAAIQAADEESMVGLKDICMYVYWELPGGCWGSPEKVAEYVESKRIKQL